MGDEQPPRVVTLCSGLAAMHSIGFHVSRVPIVRQVASTSITSPQPADGRMLAQGCGTSRSARWWRARPRTATALGRPSSPTAWRCCKCVPVHSLQLHDTRVIIKPCSDKARALLKETDSAPSSDDGCPNFLLLTISFIPRQCLQVTKAINLLPSPIRHCLVQGCN